MVPARLPKRGSASQHASNKLKKRLVLQLSPRQHNQANRLLLIVSCFFFVVCFVVCFVVGFCLLFIFLCCIAVCFCFFFFICVVCVCVCVFVGVVGVGSPFLGKDRFGQRPLIVIDIFNEFGISASRQQVLGIKY